MLVKDYTRKKVPNDSMRKMRKVRKTWSNQLTDFRTFRTFRTLRICFSLQISELFFFSLIRLIRRSQTFHQSPIYTMTLLCDYYDITMLFKALPY